MSLFTKVRSENSASLIAAARGLVPEIRAVADQIEQERRIPRHIVDKLLETRIWRMGFPPEADMITRFEVIEVIAYADGSTGWCTMLAGGGGSGLPGVSVGSVAVKDIFADKNAVVAGAVRPSGRAVAVEGGYRVSGRWPFMSGCKHATWFAGGCVVYEGDEPVLNQAGRPKTLHCFFPSTDGEILDTWYTTGLKGTGSHDVAATDIFIPNERAFDIQSWGAEESDAPLTPYQAVPGLTLIFHTPVVLGIARAALDTFIAMIEKKVGARGTPANREAQIQATVAKAEALIGSARSYALDVLGGICEKFDQGETPDFKQRALCRLSISHAHTACLEAVTMLYNLGGGSSAYAKNGMDRLMRDMHTAHQHIVADYKTYEFAGRMLMGMKPGEPMF